MENIDNPKWKKNMKKHGLSLKSKFFFRISLWLQESIMAYDFIQPHDHEASHKATNPSLIIYSSLVD